MVLRPCLYTTEDQKQFLKQVVEQHTISLSTVSNRAKLNMIAANRFTTKICFFLLIMNVFKSSQQINRFTSKLSQANHCAPRRV